MTPTVQDIMSRDPVTIGPDAPLGVALETMRRREIRHLPVVDADGRLVGILTDRDLRQACFARTRALRESFTDLRVEDVMTWAVVTIPPGASLRQAAAVMFDRRIGGLPVVSDGRLVGILTERDLLSVFARQVSTTPVDVDSLLW
jgi:CBS domain-containing protein